MWCNRRLLSGSQPNSALSDVMLMLKLQFLVTNLAARFWTCSSSARKLSNCGSQTAQAYSTMDLTLVKYKSSLTFKAASLKLRFKNSGYGTLKRKRVQPDVSGLGRMKNRCQDIYNLTLYPEAYFPECILIKWGCGCV